MPNLYIIAGCNGAGKTTASLNLLPKMFDCDEFLNADEIARGLSPINPEKKAIKAGKIMLESIDEAISKGIDFAIETTLTTTTYQKMIRKAQSKDYKVTLLFFWLNSEDLAVNRVRQRVSEGGHNIPEETIRRRYHRGIHHLFAYFADICDAYLIADNSDHEPKMICRKQMDGRIEVYNDKLLKVLKSKGNVG